MLFVCLITVFGCNQGSERGKPNILFILVDDLGWADLGYTGSTYYETPNIDNLASEGMVFTNAYAACPVCSPSRATILSGKYPARLNLTDYIPGNRKWGPHKDQKLTSHPFKLQLDLEEYTIAEALKDAGYKTMFAGKWHLGEEEKYYPQYQGFDVNIGGNNTGNPSSYFSPYKNPQLTDGYEGEYLTDRLTDEVISFMEQQREAPFFAYLSFYTVHSPLQGKLEKVEKYKEKAGKIEYRGDEYTRRGMIYHKNHQNHATYAAMVESMDENIGRLLASVENLGLDKNTIVVFTSDNGGVSTLREKTSRISTSNLPLRAGKGHMYEGGIREPLIISWPGKITPGSTSDEPVTGTDFYPTFLDLAGVDLLSGQHVDGTSLKPILSNNGGIARNAIYWHFPHYSGGLGGRPTGAVRMGKYKLIEFFEDMHVELYDLETDISEQNDLSRDMPSKTEELKEMLYQWRKEVNAKMPFPNPHYIVAKDSLKNKK